MTEFTLQALHDRIEADPLAIGYKEAGGEWKGDYVIVDLMNAKNFVVDRVSVPMEDARAAVYYDAYDTLAIDEQEWLRWMTPNAGLFQVTADMKLQLTGCSLVSNGVAGTGNDNASFWAVAHRGAMASTMLALIEVPGSDAEIAWGEGIMISAGQVGHAANL